MQINKYGNHYAIPLQNTDASRPASPAPVTSTGSVPPSAAAGDKYTTSTRYRPRTHARSRTSSAVMALTLRPIMADYGRYDNSQRSVTFDEEHFKTSPVHHRRAGAART